MRSQYCVVCGGRQGKLVCGNANIGRSQNGGKRRKTIRGSKIPMKTQRDENKHTLEILALDGRSTSLQHFVRRKVYHMGELAGAPVKVEGVTAWCPLLFLWYIFMVIY